MFMEQLYGKDNSPSRKDVFKDNCPSQKDNCPSRKTCLETSLPGRTLLRPSRRTVFMEQPPVDEVVNPHNGPSALLVLKSNWFCFKV